MIVYVTTQGAQIVKEGRHLLVRKDADIYHTLFTHRLEQLVVCGNVQLTSPALRLLLREGIDTVFLGRDGRYHGRLALAEPRNVQLRIRQFALAQDAAFCLEQARRMVAGKLLNMATVLQRIRRRRRAQQAGKAADRVRQLLERVEAAETLNGLRGLEGRASADYFAGLRYGFEGDFGFHRRVRRPPTDPVNAVLSLLYTFVINRVYAAVRLAGLDPYPGVLHTVEYGRCALPLDLVEELRPLLADTLAVSLFNLGVLKKDDFFTLEPPASPPAQDEAEQGIDAACADGLGRMTLPEDAPETFDLPEQRLAPLVPPQEPPRDGKGAVRLQPEAFRRVVTAFEKKMAGEFFHAGAGRRLSYGEALVHQARLFRRVVEGEEERYQPLLLK